MILTSKKKLSKMYIALCCWYLRLNIFVVKKLLRRKMNSKSIATVYAILAAALYAINVPLSKVFFNYVEPTMMASFLYLSAGIGLFLFGIVEKLIGKGGKKEPLTKKELPYTIAMVILDIVAPILLMLGIARTNSANVSLLNNFEIVADKLLC